MKSQKEKHLLQQFEKTKTFKRFFSTLLRFDEDLDCFIATEKWRDKEAELLSAAWWMFAEVAKIQSTPEGFEQAYSKIFSPIVKRPYPRLENGDYKYIEIDQGWKLWQAATAQAVPEGFVLVKKVYPDAIVHNQGLGLFKECQVIYGWDGKSKDFKDALNKGFYHGVKLGAKAVLETAMIEAQEQSHD